MAKSPHEIARQIRPAYRRGNKAQKSQLLDKFIKQTGYHRKAAIRLLNEGVPKGEGGWSKKKG